MATAILVLEDMDDPEGAVKVKCRYDMSLEKIPMDPDSPAHALAQKLMQAVYDTHETQSAEFTPTHEANTTLQ